MSFKRLFQASFKESLRLRKDKISGKFARDNLKSAQEKEKFRGTKQSYVWLTILTVLFIIGPNWLIAVVNNYLFYHPDPSGFTITLSDYNFLPYETFWGLLLIWLVIILLGKRFNQTFILIYRGQFHLLVTFIIWLILELNLFFMTGFYGTIGISGALVFWGSVVVASYLVIRSRVVSLLELMYGPTMKQTSIDRFINKLFRLLMTYGWGLVGLGIIARIVFFGSNTFKADWFGILLAILIWFAINILMVAFESYLIFPYMLQGYYKLKYPEEYREWEEQTSEEWYGEKYLKKYGGGRLPFEKGE